MIDCPLRNGSSALAFVEIRSRITVREVKDPFRKAEIVFRGT
jgi:hypothetical protein